MKKKINKMIDITIDDISQQMNSQNKKSEEFKTRKQKILEEHEKIKAEINNSKFKF